MGLLFSLGLLMSMYKWDYLVSLGLLMGLYNWSNIIEVDNSYGLLLSRKKKKKESIYF